MPTAPPSPELLKLMDQFKDADPLILAIFAKLPPAGSVWPDADRERWFGAIEGAFALIYPTAQAVAERRNQVRRDVGG